MNRQARFYWWLAECAEGLSIRLELCSEWLRPRPARLPEVKKATKQPQQRRVRKCRRNAGDGQL